MDYIKFDEELKKLAGIYQKLFEDVECSVWMEKPLLVVFK